MATTVYHTVRVDIFGYEKRFKKFLFVDSHTTTALYKKTRCASIA